MFDAWYNIFLCRKSGIKPGLIASQTSHMHDMSVPELFSSEVNERNGISI